MAHPQNIVDTAHTLSLSDLTMFAPAYIATRTTMALFSSPGTGKTSWVRNTMRGLVAQHYNVPVTDVALLEYELPTVKSPDLRGFLVPVGAEDGSYHSVYAVPPMIHDVESSGCEYGIILIDEITKGTRDTSNGIAPLMEDHVLGGHPLPDGWHVVVCGNYTTDKSGDIEMPGFQRNRCAFVHIRTDMDALIMWARREHIAESFIAAVEYLTVDAFAHAVPKGQVQFPTPRTVMGKAYPFIAAMLGDAVDEWDVASIQRGLLPLVGAEYAKGLADFYAFGKDLPKLADIDRDPENCKVPSRGQHAALALLKGRILQTMTPENVIARLTYIQRIPAGDIRATMLDQIQKGGYMLYLENTPEGKALLKSPEIKTLMKVAAGKV